MKTKKAFYFASAGVMLLLFFILIVLVRTVDVKPIGPMGTSVGLAFLNQFVFDTIGTHLFWYTLTDWLGLAAIGVAFGFAFLGLCQLVHRKSFLKVDGDLYLLGAYYVVIILLYILFEICIVNYRPVLLSEYPEASFPSSHTMIVFCIMGAAIVEFSLRIRRRWLRLTANALCTFVMAITVGGRLFCGVHWFTDILGGVLLGSGLVFLFAGAVRNFCQKLFF